LQDTRFLSLFPKSLLTKAPMIWINSITKDVNARTKRKAKAVKDPSFKNQSKLQQMKRLRGAKSQGNALRGDDQRQHALKEATIDRRSNRKRSKTNLENRDSSNLELQDQKVSVSVDLTVQEVRVSPTEKTVEAPVSIVNPAKVTNNADHTGLEVKVSPMERTVEAPESIANLVKAMNNVDLTGPEVEMTDPEPVGMATESVETAVVIADVVVGATQAVAAEAVKAVRALTPQRPTRTHQSRRKIRSTERCEKLASE
jgi:beta-mannanase